MGPSASTPRSKASGAVEDCHEYDPRHEAERHQQRAESAAGRRRHQYRPISIGAAVR